MTPIPYPIQLDLRGRTVRVFGAGHVATRKLRRLVDTGAQLAVIAPRASEDVQRWAAQGALTLAARSAEPADCSGAVMVICATDQPALNTRLAAAARAHGALALRVDAPEDSDFSVPARALGQHVDATISTHGRAPSASKRLGRELRSWLDTGPERFVAAVASARSALRAHPEAELRLRALSDGPLFDACRSGDERAVEALVADALAAELRGAP